MFCVKCGRPTEGEKIVCDQCAGVQAPVAVEPPMQAPVAPVVQEPAAPVYQAPVVPPAPAVQAPAAPVVQEPAAPVYQAPVAPPAPAAPVVQEPVAPVYQAPAAPVYQAPAAPIYQAPMAQEPVAPVAPPMQAPAAPVTPVAPPAPPMQAPVEAAPAFTVNTNTSEPPKAKKKVPIGLIIGIAAAVLAVAVVVAGIFLWPVLFGGDDEIDTETVEQTEPKANTEAVVKSAGAAYGAFLEGLQIPATTTTSVSDCTLTVTAGEDLLAMVKTALANENVDLDVSWLQSVSLNVKSGDSGDNYGAALGVGLNGTNVLTLDVFADVAAGVFYLGCPELSDTYISAPIDDEVDASAMTATAEVPQEIAEQLAKDLPDQAAFEAMLDKYLTLVIEQMKDGEKSKKTFSVNDISQELTVIDRQITEQDATNLVVAVLEAAKDDATVHQFITAAVNYTNSYNAYLAETGGYTYTPVNAEDIIDELPDLISELKSQDASDEAIKLTTYTDKDGNFCGCALTDVDGQLVVDFVQVFDGEKSALELTLPDDVVIRGLSEQKGDTTASSFDVVIENEKLITVRLETADDEVVATFVPGAALLEEMSTDIPMLAMAGSVSPELKLTAKEDSVDVEVYLNSKLFVGLNMTVNDGAAYTPVKPGKYISAEDQETLKNWLTQLDVTRVAEALKTANVPQQYIDLLSQLVTLLPTLVDQETTPPTTEIPQIEATPVPGAEAA